MEKCRNWCLAAEEGSFTSQHRLTSTRLASFDDDGDDDDNNDDDDFGNVDDDDGCNSIQQFDIMIDSILIWCHDDESHTAAATVLLDARFLAQFHSVVQLGSYNTKQKLTLVICTTR